MHLYTNNACVLGVGMSNGRRGTVGKLVEVFSCRCQSTNMAVTRASQESRGGGCTRDLAPASSVSALSGVRVAVGCSVPPGAQPGEARAGLCVQYIYRF